MNEWRDIESAPRDGTRVLLCAPNWFEPVIGQCWPKTGSWYHGDEESPLNYGACSPTHWMPLPSPLSYAIQTVPAPATQPDTPAK